jgi:hypothetical protein
MRIDPVEFTIHTKDGDRKHSIPIGSVAGARFSSRDRAAMRKTLDELRATGMGGTGKNPSIFRIARYLLTQAEEFEVQGPLTGGEAEVVAIREGDEIWISLGSDQCDRELDPLFQDKPKQMCPHPIARDAWSYAEVKDHWDELEMHSEVVVGDHVVPYQDNALSVLVDVEFLLGLEDVKSLPFPSFLYCGASSAAAAGKEKIKELGLSEDPLHGIGDRFRMRLFDPVHDRAIEHEFSAVPVGDDLEDRRKLKAELGL